MMKKLLCKTVSLLLVISFAVGFAGCGNENNEKIDENPIIVRDDTVYETRQTPLNEAGAKMNVRISAEPGEDPFEVLSTAAPDPFVTFDAKTDYYYGLATQNNRIEINRSKKLADLFISGETQVVYRVGDKIFDCLWAPEMYFADGHWYIYSSGTTDTEDNTKHMFVLESKTEDPFDGFEFKAFLNNDIFGIDPTIYVNTASGRRFICFSRVLEGKQWLSIAEMSNPWTMGKVVEISEPTDYTWENLNNENINEGPFFVTSGDRLFIIFSANGCYNDMYRLGLLEYQGGNILSKDSWVKAKDNIFMLNRENHIFAPGHASFFYSPDHTELWVAYHCFYSGNPQRKRRMRVCQVQKVSFDETGYPIIGTPLANGTMIDVPSGE